MSTGRISSHYARDAAVQELAGELTEEEVLQLHTSLRALGLSGWLDWLESHQEDAETYLRGTPKERERFRRRFEPEDGRLLLLYGAVVISVFAAELACEFHDPSLWDERDSRHRRAARGGLLLRAFLAFEPFWPFQGPNPFAKPGPRECPPQGR